jgi:hypothetical protein
MAVFVAKKMARLFKMKAWQIIKRVGNNQRNTNSYCVSQQVVTATAILKLVGAKKNYKTKGKYYFKRISLS